MRVSRAEIKRRLLAVRRRILRYPERYDQNTTDCGSVCCIAGHLDSLVNPKLYAQASDWSVVARRALAAIGHTDMSEWPHLIGASFYACGNDAPPQWRDLAYRLDQARSPRERALVGAAAIDLYIVERKL